jgi:hypothetical protein
MSEIEKGKLFGRTVTYKGFTGTIIAKQLPLQANGMITGYLISVPKPVKTKDPTVEEFDGILKSYADIFKCNPETLGPCVNRIVDETELEFHELD